MMKEEFVIVKIFPSIIMGRNALREVKIKLDEKSTVDTVLLKLYELQGIPGNIYDETLKRFVHVFWTRTLIKNGAVIARFGINGLEPMKDSDLSINDGDELTIILPVGGG